MKNLILLYITIIFVGCFCKDSNKHCKEFRQNDIDKLKPYNNLEELYFVNVVTFDTIILKKESDNESETPLGKGSFGLFGCQGECLKERIIKYSTSNNDFPENIKTINIKLQQEWDNSGASKSECLIFDYNNNIIFSYDKSIDYNRLVVNNIEYRDVKKYDINQTDVNNIIRYIYATEDDGILRIDIRNSDVHYERIK